MGAWVAAVLHDLLHDTDSLIYSPAPWRAGVTRTGIAIAGGSRVR